MNRKDFISLSALGFLGLYSCGSSVLMKPRKNLGIQLYTIRDAVSENVEKALEKLAEMGFKNLEIYGYNGSFFGKTKNEFSQILKNTGLKVISSHHTSGFLDKGKGTLQNQWEKSVEDLHFLGTEYMVCSYLFPEERTTEIYKKLPDLLQKSALITKNSGIQMAYHNHDFEFDEFENGESFYDFLLKNTTPDLVKMELDLYWISKVGKNPVDYFEKYPGRFPLWHVKDLEAKTQNFTEIGNGIIDFETIFAAKEKAGLKHWFLEQDESKGDIFESIKKSQNFVIGKNYFW